MWADADKYLDQASWSGAPREDNSVLRKLTVTEWRSRWQCLLSRDQTGTSPWTQVRPSSHRWKELAPPSFELDAWCSRGVGAPPSDSAMATRGQA